MEDLIPILVFLFFIVAPLLEKMLKAGKKEQEPPPRPRPRPRQQQAPKPYQRRAETASDSAPRSEAEAGTAADMLPEDLWAILTGEAPPSRPRDEPGRVDRPEAPKELPRAPAPRQQAPRPGPPRPRKEPLPSQQRKMPVPLPDRDRTAVGEERFGVRADPAADRPQRADYTPEDYRRPAPLREEPVIVSMETLPEQDEVRHTKFHDRLAALAAPSGVDRGKARVDVGLHDPAALRRAIIVAEILGTPRGLE